jgi:hypothetical protein
MRAYSAAQDIEPKGNDAAELGLGERLSCGRGGKEGGRRAWPTEGALADVNLKDTVRVQRLLSFNVGDAPWLIYDQGRKGGAASGRPCRSGR